MILLKERVMRKAYRFQRANKFFVLLLLVAILVITYLSIPYDGFYQHNNLVLITFILNGFLWTLLLLNEVKHRAYSFNMMHWAFCLLFFFIAAIVQYLSNSFPWIGEQSDCVLIQTNLFLTRWTVSVFLGGLLNRNAPTVRHTKLFVMEWDDFQKWIPLLTLISIFNLVYRINAIGILNLLSRSTNTIQYADSSSAALLVGKILQSVVYISAVLSVHYRMRTRKGILWCIINILCLIISYFPTGVARYITAMIYMGLMLTCSSRLKSSRVFILLFLCAFMIGLPFLNFFRNLAFSEVILAEALRDAVSDISGMWLSGDYDAYAMMSLTVEYVGQNSPTWGRQFIGVLLFWVPRAWWPEKPVGSGYFVSESMGMTFNNVCCPLPGEGMINFGLPGIILFGLFIGFFITRIDGLYWGSIDFSGKRLRYMDIVYPAACILFFFMSRGDLMSSFAYMMALVVVWYILVILSRLRIGRGYIRYLRSSL